MKKLFRFQTLSSRIYTLFTIVIFLTIFIMQIVSFRFTISTIKNSTLNNNRALLKQLVTQIDKYIIDMKHIALMVNADMDVQNYLLTMDPMLAKKIQGKFVSYLDVRDDISSIFLFSNSGKVITGRPGFKLNPWANYREKDWYKKTIMAKGRTVVSSSYVQNLIKGRYSWVVSLSREIQSIETSRRIGIILVDLKFNKIKDLCKSLVIGEKGYNFIIDNKGNYVYHPTQQLVYSGIKREPIKPILELLKSNPRTFYQDREKYYMIDTSDQTGWHIVSVSYVSDIAAKWNYVQIIYSLLGFFLFFVTGLATNAISESITKPLRQLQKTMRSVDTGEFRKAGNIGQTEEIKELAREYDTMVTRIEELMEANIREQEQKRKSDLRALQAQINPHFLYNTLDSIIWMAEMKKSAEVVKMTSALSKLFRISISKGKELIPIKDEISHVESYLVIQKMRYRDKFDYSFSIDKNILNLFTLKIILQPLVENSIYHGTKEIEHTIHIEIEGKQRGNIVVFTITDNGRGIEPEELQLLNSSETPEKIQKLKYHGVGIKNVNERIKLYFGEEYGLTFKSKPGEGAIVTIKIPAIQSIPEQSASGEEKEL